MMKISSLEKRLEKWKTKLLKIKEIFLDCKNKIKQLKTE